MYSKCIIYIKCNCNFGHAHNILVRFTRVLNCLRDYTVTAAVCNVVYLQLKPLFQSVRIK